MKCEKRKFRSRADAMLAMFEMDQRPSEGVYRCYERGCKGAWHVTSRAGKRRTR
jgi:hypothetical protein